MNLLASLVYNYRPTTRIDNYGSRSDSIVATVMGSYFQLRSDILNMRIQQDSQNRVTEIRLKVLESQITVLQRQINVVNSSTTK